jgi:hypothetical protein
MTMTDSDEAIRIAKRNAQAFISGSAGEIERNVLQDAKSVLIAAAERDDAEAQNLIGAIALEIDGDALGAFSWFVKSAALGDPVGQRSLGYFYATGTAVPVDLEKAIGLYRSAAEEGDFYAMYNLAATNLRADGRYGSFAETLQFLTDAANFGIPEAAAELGDALARVDRDEEAISWYRKAAISGHVGAMNALASWYRDGIHGEPNLIEALHWFLAMLNYGNGDGMHEAIQIAPLMTEMQVREGARLAGREAEGEALLFGRE